MAAATGLFPASRIGIMCLIFRLFLATRLLLHQEAFACHDWEYEIAGECCPTCGIGYRVSHHCTAASSTSCVPCTNGTYTDHPNGLSRCFRCRVCDSGAQLRVKGRCTYTKNTVCACKEGYFCVHPIGRESCERCEKHSVAPPGHRVTQAGTEISDTKFEPCPPGTFSATEMSSSCKHWTNCSSKEGITEVQAGSATLDAVCTPPKPEQLTTTQLVAAVLLPVLLLVGCIGFIIWRRKKRDRNGAAEDQEEAKRAYHPVQENDNNMVEPMQETAQNRGEPTYTVA